MNEFGPIETPKTSLRHPIEEASFSVHTVGMVAFLSGFCGFFVGCVRLASWHHAIESAQVLAGIVNYPPNNPFYIYHTKIWSLFIQVCTAMLYLGFSERFIAYVISGLLAMICFQGLAICAFAFCRNAFVSVLAPWLIVFCLLSAGDQIGLPYAGMVPGHIASYGLLGQFAVFLSVVLLGAGVRRAGSFLLGVCPAFHFVLGVWAWFLVLTCLFWDLKREKGLWAETTSFFLLGCGVLMVSLTVHFMTIHQIPNLPADLSAAYVEAFLRYWTSHQEPVPPSSLGLWLNLVAVCMSLSWLYRFSDLVPRTSLIILRAFVLAGAFALVMAVLTWLPNSMVPTAIQRIIPGRFLNFVVFGSMAVVIGLLGSQKSLIARIMLGSIFVGLPLLYLFRTEIPPLVRPKLMFIYCAMSSFIGKWSAKDRDGPKILQASSSFHRIWNTQSRLMVAGLCIMLTLSLAPYMSSRRSVDLAGFDRAIDDWSNDPFYAHIHATGGIIVTSSINIIQLKTRNPILLDSAINMLGYVPECGPEMERILRFVYGINIFDPSKGKHGYGRLDENLYRKIWEARPLKEWIDIKAKFGVTQVVTHVDWQLQLQETSRNKWYKAYVIP